MAPDVRRGGSANHRLVQFVQFSLSFFWVVGLHQYLPKDYETKMQHFHALLSSMMATRGYTNIVVGDETGVRVEDIPSVTMETRGKGALLQISSMIFQFLRPRCPPNIGERTPDVHRLADRKTVKERRTSVGVERKPPHIIIFLI
jgi:hypothetical protein